VSPENQGVHGLVKRVIKRASCHFVTASVCISCARYLSASSCFFRAQHYPVQGEGYGSDRDGTSKGGAVGRHVTPDQ
jgi:hypothetical protein